MLIKAQASARAITEHQNSSPSPNTVLKSVHSSGNYLCSQRSLEMPSPTVKYYEMSPTQNNNQNMMQHRNNYSLFQQHDKRYEFEEINDLSRQHQPQFQFYNPAQNQHPMNETQQQADQHTIELRMNNLGNENLG